MFNGLFNLEGKCAVVTGAGRGLGADIASLLAQSGAHVYLLSKDAGKLDDVAARIHRNGGACTPVVCDLLKDDQLERAFDDLPRLDILVNNAGTNIPARLADVTTRDLDFVINLNIRATFLATRAAVRKMLEGEATDDRVIINISSQMGHVGAPDRSVYCMTKHAMEGLTKAAAVELAPRIRVNTVAPTFVDTPMTQPFFENEQFKSWVFDRIPMGRLLSSDHVAAAVLYLASPAAAMITGTSLRIDGGWTAQ
ncbi:SDR family NAD(P)-dependent oxidoreductase [Caballeronia insecticola]|uniref:Short-chain dehydrogenase/reductase SDR n=1 Tax=Caballeronia insecticola TaxID=758793 RepID=R4WLM7_9BURK|nr:SDR family oxidoreductase [Caballeronia insecticola]BAN25394.1 short-chain dehydrogenase/reductase SDR [Caballeronia insecticola]